MKAICTYTQGRLTHEHYPKELHSFVDPDAIGVVLDNSGQSLNRYADGTVGVSDEIAMWAEEDEEPYCAEHDLPISKWEHER